MLGVFAVLITAGFSIGLVTAENQKLVDLIGNTAAGILGAVLVGTWAALKGAGSATGDGSPATSARAADVLAPVVREQYEQWLGARKLEERELPVPVTWVWFSHEVAGRPEDALRSGLGVGPSLFEVLPGSEAASPAMLAEGGLGDLFKVYAGVRTGRVVVLGAPGAGKSAAAIITALHALGHRAGLDEETRAQVPVPVLLTPHDWNPKQQKLTDWLAGRLRSDFNALHLPGFDRWTPEQLIRDRRVALFLDGFEDIETDEQRVEALHALRHLRVPLVLFSRTEEFTRAARQMPFLGAVVVELTPVPATVAAGCLRAWQPAGVSRALQRRLAEQVLSEPGGILARALSTPLMLTLLRDAFPDGHSEGFTALVDELLTPDGFAAPEDVHDLLLRRVLPAAYPPDHPDTPSLYTLEQAERWLGHIAAQMSAKGTRQLAWWRVHEWASASWRILAGVVSGGFAAGLIAGLVAWFTDSLGERTVPGVVPAAVAGGALGLATGFVTERRAARVVVLRGSGRTGFNAGMGLMSGVAVGAAVALTVGPAAGPVAVAIAAPLATVTAGVTTGFAATGDGLIPPAATRRARASLPMRFLGRLIAGLPAGLATGAPAGLASAVPLGFAQGTWRGLVVGLAIGLAYTVAFGLIDGFARISPEAGSPVGPMSAWTQDKAYSLSTGLAFGLAVGFAAGLTDTLAMARHDPFAVAIPVGLITGVVFGVVTGIAAALTVSHSWRTMVVFVQLWTRRQLPLRAMRFLEDARERQVLRETGPYYEFRHARLQDHLTRLEQERSDRASRVPEPDADPVPGSASSR